MVFGHSPIRLAVSSDLSSWEPKGNLFTDTSDERDLSDLFNDARDPNILFHEGKYYIVYCSKKSVYMRESEDLIHWSDAQTIFRTETFDPESLTLLHYQNSFYLFLCSRDG